MTLPSRRQRLVRGSARLGSQRGSWLIIQRKWTKERERDGGSHSAAIRRAERKREQGKNGEVAERGGREGEIDRKRIGGKGRERREKEKEKKIRLINTWSVTRWCRVHTSKRWCKGRNLAPARSNFGCSRCSARRRRGDRQRARWQTGRRQSDCLSLCLILHSRR